MESARMAPLRLTVVLCSLLASGCAILPVGQDARYQYVNRKRASCAWKECFTREKRRCLSIDFECGFKAGFYDTATGKDCRLPPVAPSKYWAAKYQCCEGQVAVQDWFRGYQSGIMVAQGRSLDHFNDVPVSCHAPVINQTACGLCRADDPCEDCGCGPANGPGIMGCNPCGTGHRIHPGNNVPMIHAMSDGEYYPPIPLDEDELDDGEGSGSADAPSQLEQIPAAPVEGSAAEDSEASETAAESQPETREAELEARAITPQQQRAALQDAPTQAPAIKHPPLPIINLSSRLPNLLEKQPRALRTAGYAPNPGIIGGLGAENQFAMVGPSDANRILANLPKRAGKSIDQPSKKSLKAEIETKDAPESSKDSSEGAVKLAPEIFELPK